VSARAIPKQGSVLPYSQMSRGLRPLWFKGPLPMNRASDLSGKTARLALHVPPLVYQNVPNRRTHPWGELGYWKQRNAGSQSPLHHAGALEATRSEIRADPKSIIQ
jgi:hypothetical protein